MEDDLGGKVKSNLTKKIRRSVIKAPPFFECVRPFFSHFHGIIVVNNGIVEDTIRDNERLLVLHKIRERGSGGSATHLGMDYQNKSKRRKTSTEMHNTSTNNINNIDDNSARYRKSPGNFFYPIAHFKTLLTM